MRSTNSWLLLIACFTLLFGVTSCDEDSIEVEQSLPFQTTITSTADEVFFGDTVTLSFIVDELATTIPYWGVYYAEQGEGNLLIAEQDILTPGQQFSLAPRTQLQYVAKEVGTHRLTFYMANAYNGRDTLEWELNVQELPKIEPPVNVRFLIDTLSVDSGYAVINLYVRQQEETNLQAKYSLSLNCSDSQVEAQVSLDETRTGLLGDYLEITYAELMDNDYHKFIRVQTLSGDLSGSSLSVQLIDPIGTEYVVTKKIEELEIDEPPINVRLLIDTLSADSSYAEIDLYVRQQEGTNLQATYLLSLSCSDSQVEAQVSLDETRTGWLGDRLEITYAELLDNQYRKSIKVRALTGKLLGNSLTVRLFDSNGTEYVVTKKIEEPSS